MSRYKSRNDVEWENGICGCFNDCSICILTYFCPCVIFGQTAQAVGDNFCLCCCAGVLCPLCARLHVRERIRQKKDLKGTWGLDYCLIMLCGLCTLCQENQEVKDLLAKHNMARE